MGNISFFFLLICLFFRSSSFFKSGQFSSRLKLSLNNCTAKLRVAPIKRQQVAATWCNVQRAHAQRPLSSIKIFHSSIHCDQHCYVMLFQIIKAHIEHRLPFMFLSQLCVRLFRFDHSLNDDGWLTLTLSSLYSPLIRVLTIWTYWHKVQVKPLKHAQINK